MKLNADAVLVYVTYAAAQLIGQMNARMLWEDFREIVVQEDQLVWDVADRHSVDEAVLK